MAGTGVSLYAVTAAGNKAVIGTIDWREDTYLPNQINDNVAQIMADMRALVNSIGTGWVEVGDGEGTYTATYVSATSFRFDGVDVTAYYRAGMRVRVTAPTPGTLSGTIASSTFSTHTTLVVVWDSGSLSNEAITSVQIGIAGTDTAATFAQPRSYRNILGRNGGLEVWQRGAGGSAAIAVAASSLAYTADGWALATTANQASTVTQVAGIATGSRYAAKVQRNAGQTGTGSPVFEFPLDTDEIVAARGSVVTLSLTLAAGANWSPASGNIFIALYTGTGSPAKRVIGAYAGEATPINVTQTIGAAARYTFVSSALGASVSQASISLGWTPTGTAGADDAFTVDDVQLEIGSVATPFERRPFEGELLACRRHYWKSFAYATAPAQNVGINTGALEVAAGAAGAVQMTLYARCPVQMRSTPTLITYNPAAANANPRDSSVTVDGTVSNSFNTTADQVVFAIVGNAASVVGSRMQLHAQADAGI